MLWCILCTPCGCVWGATTCFGSFHYCPTSAPLSSWYACFVATSAYGWASVASNSPWSHLPATLHVGVDLSLPNLRPPLPFYAPTPPFAQLCVKMYPPGEISGNVFHNNAGFGWYINNGFPLKVSRQLPAVGGAEAGFVTDWGATIPSQPKSPRAYACAQTPPRWRTRQGGRRRTGKSTTSCAAGSCSPFDLWSGGDNAHPYVIRDHVEYNQDFGAGVYDHGDVTFTNYISAWNLKGLYWKTCVTRHSAACLGSLQLQAIPSCARPSLISICMLQIGVALAVDRCATDASFTRREQYVLLHRKQEAVSGEQQVLSDSALSGSLSMPFPIEQSVQQRSNRRYVK